MNTYQHKDTGAIMRVTAEQWQNIVAAGYARNWKLVKSEPETKAQPKGKAPKVELPESVDTFVLREEGSTDEGLG